MSSKKIGYIYRMYSNDKQLNYYGKTTQRVYDRIKTHRNCYKRWKNGNGTFTSSYLVIDTDDWDYMVVERVEYEHDYELKNKERDWVETNECVNKQMPNRSKKEYDEAYYEQNKEQLKEQSKQYRETNKEHIKERRKQYYQAKQKETVNCDCGWVGNRHNLPRHLKSKRHLKWLESQEQNETNN